jgi:D-alanyl-lipoteichoic acid acyltransferase DltB (MBOAT superfamily)
VIFHSLDFLVFFVVVTAAYWALPHRGQNVLLLAASYVFYAYVHPWFIVLIAFTTLTLYWAAREIEDRPAHRTAWLWIGIAANLAILGFFKYFNFFAENVRLAFGAAGLTMDPVTLRIMLPVGISFYTFQAISYVVDVYRGELRARRDLLDVALFIAFFPQLVAGPILRASFFVPQVEQRRRFSVEHARSGVTLICWGYFKKLVIADNVAIIANKVFALADPSFPILWAGVFAFAIQIYADFSAYIDIARGVSRWFGFELTDNFDHPYLARTPSDFWRRWNMSLSTWFRDYVYVPLGGSRAGEWRWARNVLITFLLSGLWHGASWNYVLWGLYHGVLLVATRAHQILWPARTHPARTVPGAAVLRPLVTVLQVLGMFVLTNIGWLLFRETELSAILRDLQLSPFAASALDRQIGLYLFALAFLYSLPLWIQSIFVELTRTGRELAPRHPTEHAVSPGWPRVVAQGVMCGAAVAAVLLLRSTTALDFIYFQF